MPRKLPDLRHISDVGEAHRILASYGLKYSHSASDSRYISKKIGYGICEEYSGRYGSGVIVRKPETRLNKNPLHSVVEYWLEVERVGTEK